MPNNNVVQITLSAKDAATDVVKNLTKSLEGATLKAQLLSQTIFAGVSSGLSAISSKFKSTADLQQSLLSEASTYAALTGRSFSDAEALIDKLGAKIDEFAECPLPGVAQDYKKIATGIESDLIPAFTSLTGVFDEGLFLKNISDITKGLGVLSQSSHVTNENTAAFASKLLQGSSIDELKHLEFATSNSAFLPMYERKLKEIGKTAETATRADRALALKLVTQQLVTPELISRSSNSINGLLGSLKDKLFSPTKGIFGLLKDLDEKTKGNQSVLSAFNNTLKLLIGDNGLFDSIGKTLTLLGVDPDFILKSLKGGIDNLNNWISSLNSFVSSINTNIQGKDKGQIVKEFIQGITINVESFLKSINFKGVGSETSNILNSIIKGLSSIDFKSIFSFIGQSASNFLKGFNIDGSKFKGLLDKLTEGINSINWSVLFKVLGDALAFATNIIFQIISKIDWLKVIGGLFDGIGEFLTKLDWNTIFSVLAKLLIGGVVVSFTVGLAALTAAVVGLPALFIAPLVGLFVGLLAIIKVKWDDITRACYDFYKWIAEGFSNIGKDVKDDLDKFVAKPVIGLISFLGNFFTNLWKDTEILCKSVADSVTGFFKGIKDKFDGLLSKIPGLGSDSNKGNTSKVPNAASGMVGGLLEAAIRENNSSPSGAGLVVANTSEAILTRQQQASLLQNRGGMHIDTIIINTQAANAKDIADDIFKVLAQNYQRFAENNLAVSV